MADTPIEDEPIIDIDADTVLRSIKHSLLHLAGDLEGAARTMRSYASLLEKVSGTS